MATILGSTSIYYDNVNLVPSPAKIQSREEVPNFLNRIIVAPMHAVVGEDFMSEATKAGLTVCAHRFGTVEENVDLFLASKNRANTFASIGLKDWDRAAELAKAGAKNWLIDCANGYLPQIHATIAKLFKDFEVKKLMVGNVVTARGVAEFSYVPLQYNVPVYVRIGIGGGSACKTSDVTGFNRGQITEILECREAVGKLSTNKKIKLIADGGIRDSGCAAKAFGAGCEFVMLGGYFANADCAYTWTVGDGTYWGGASTKQQQLCGSVRRHGEGRVNVLDSDNVKPLSELIADLKGGLASAISYSGHSRLEDFIGNGVFERKA